MRLAIIIVLVFAHAVSPSPAWLADPDAPVAARALLYSFFHANAFHLAVNLMSAWLAVRRKGSALRLAVAYVIAVLVYPISLMARPAIGFSDVLFAFIGLGTPALKAAWWRSPRTIGFLAAMPLLGMLPQFSAVTHVASFLIGVFVASLSRRLKRLMDDARRAGR